MARSGPGEIEVYRSEDGAELAVVGATWHLQPKTTFESLHMELERDPVKFWRNYGSKLTGSSESPLRDPEAANTLANRNRSTPWDHSRQEFYAHFRGEPGAVYFIHFDLAKNHDSAGVALVHRDADTRKVVVDFMDGVVGQNGSEIQIAHLREQYVYELTKRGFEIRKISYDQWQCVAAGTMVNTQRGVLPVEQVTVGDLVQSRSGPKPVTKVHQFGSQETLRLTTTHGETLEATPRHRIEVLESGVFRVGEPRKPVWVWRRLDAIKVGDVVRMATSPHTLPEPPEVRLTPMDAQRLGPGTAKLRDWHSPETLTPTLAEWLGLVWGDGNVTQDGVTVTCAQHEGQDAVGVFTRLFQQPFEVRPKGNYGTVGISSRLLVLWLTENGLAKDKGAIPTSILCSPRPVQAAFLRGLFSADGSVNKNDGSISLFTASKTLAASVQVLLRTAFGLPSNVFARTRAIPLNGRVYTETHYVVNVGGSRAVFADAVGFCYQSKASILAEHRHRSGRSLYAKVKSITTAEAEVFDLTVADDPSYVANGFISHNSLESQQILKRQGYEVEECSADKTMEPYDTLFDLLTSGQLDYYIHPQFIREMQQLRRIGGKKYDHPKHGSKDVSDSVACACWKLTEFELENPDYYGQCRIVVRRNPATTFRSGLSD